MTKLTPELVTPLRLANVSTSFEAMGGEEAEIPAFDIGLMSPSRHH